MSRHAIATRPLLLLACLGLVLPLAACGGGTQPPAAPATAARPQEDTALDLKPILRDFLAGLPEDWHQVPARDIAGLKPFIVDVRQPEDYAKGFIAGAVNVPLRELAKNLQALPALDREIVVVCDTGHRSAIGMALLRMLGYNKARSLEGGLQAWRQARLAVVTEPVPARPGGQAPQVDERLRTAFNYYLERTLPTADEGAISLAALTEDQLRKSSAELEAQADTYDQGRSLLLSVDTPEEFAKSRLSKTLNVPLRDLATGLDNVPLPEVIGWACGVPDAYHPEPRMTRFTVVSRSGHRAALGMMTMQLLGFHFVGALDGDLGTWKPIGPVAVA
jgi:rhodanese-related sulfurtransferase